MRKTPPQERLILEPSPLNFQKFQEIVKNDLDKIAKLQENTSFNQNSINIWLALT